MPYNVSAVYTVGLTAEFDVPNLPQRGPSAGLYENFIFLIKVTHTHFLEHWARWTIRCIEQVHCVVPNARPLMRCLWSRLEVGHLKSAPKVPPFTTKFVVRIAPQNLALVTWLPCAVYLPLRSLREAERTNAFGNFPIRGSWISSSSGILQLQSAVKHVMIFWRSCFSGSSKKSNLL